MQTTTSNNLQNVSVPTQPLDTNLLVSVEGALFDTDIWVVYPNNERKVILSALIMIILV